MLQCPVADCPNPFVPENGQVEMLTGLSFNSTAEYSCSDGYILVGNDTVVCQDDGTWSDSPNCQGR